jgi:hypothetical protein
VALLPPDFLDAVVTIEIATGSEENPFGTMATGFLVAFSTSMKHPSEDKRVVRVFLVTNRHVFNGVPEVYLKFNKTDEAKRYLLRLTGDRGGKQEAQLWDVHTDKRVDIALIPLDGWKLKNDGIIFKTIKDEHIAYFSQIQDRGITQGDSIFVLGFPLARIIHEFPVASFSVLT